MLSIETSQMLRGVKNLKVIKKEDLGALQAIWNAPAPEVEFEDRRMLVGEVLTIQISGDLRLIQDKRKVFYIYKYDGDPGLMIMVYCPTQLTLSSFGICICQLYFMTNFKA